MCNADSHGFTNGSCAIWNVVLYEWTSTLPPPPTAPPPVGCIDRLSRGFLESDLDTSRAFLFAVSR